jgi:hypothetical protein
MKTIFFALLVLQVISEVAFSQSIDQPQFNYTGTEFTPAVDKFIGKHQMLRLYLSRYLSTNEPQIYSKCLKGVVMVRFRFEEHGKISEINCSKTAPEELRIALKKAIKASEKYWVVPAEFNTKQHWFVQPITYEWGGGKCSSPDYFSMQGGLFEYDDGPKGDFMCTFLSTLVTSSIDD